MKINNVKHPALRYHGAKFRLAPWIISHFPEHKCYVEPFGGAAGVLLRKKRSYAEVYNDLDDDIVNFFRVMRDTDLSKKLIKLCQLTPYSRTEFNNANQPAHDPLEQARLTVIRACMGYGSAAISGGNSGFRRDSKREYGIPSHLWARYHQTISAISDRFQGVIVENQDAIKVMNAHDTKDTLHYCDPPYHPETRVKGNRYYRHEMTTDQHIKLLEVVKNLQGMVIISGYETELYNDLLNGWRKEITLSRISAGRGTGIRKECLWLSPNIEVINAKKIPQER